MVQLCYVMLFVFLANDCKTFVVIQHYLLLKRATFRAPANKRHCMRLTHLMFRNIPRSGIFCTCIKTILYSILLFSVHIYSIHVHHK